MQLQDGIKFQSFKQEEIPSYRAGNLAISPNYLAYSSFKDIDRVIVHQLEKIFSTSQNITHPLVILMSGGQNVTSVKYHLLNNQQILLITTYSELLIYKENGQQLIYKYQLEQQKLPLQLQQQFLTSSIIQASDGFQHITIMNSNNQLILASQSNNVYFVEQVDLNKVIVNTTSMDSNLKQMNLFISSDQGNVFVLSTQTKNFELKQVINVSPEDAKPILILKSLENHLACGDLSGQITIIETTNFKILFTVTAHVRFINGLEFIQEMDLLMSYSEDTFLQIWKIEKDQVKIQNSICINDSMIFACVPYGRKIVAATYDTSCLTLVQI